MAYCSPGNRLIDPPDHFKGGSNPTRHRRLGTQRLFVSFYNIAFLCTVLHLNLI